MKKFLKPFGITVTGTLISTSLGVVSNKIVAVTGGPEVSALIAMFRQLYSGLSNGLAVGADTTVVQNLSSIRTSENISRVCRMIVFYLWFCAALVGGVAFFLSDRISVALLGPAQGASHVMEVRLVILFSFLGLCLTFVIAILNAYLHVKRVVFLNIVASSVTASCVYFIIVGFPSIGPALIVGLGNVVALLLGYWFLRQTIGALLVQANVRMSNVLDLLRPGLMMAGLTIMNLGVVLTVQSLVAREFGLYRLGFYTASYTIVSAFMMLFMSPMKSYVLPALGSLTSRVEKGEFVNSVLRLILLVMCPFALGLLWFRAGILEILYSSQFFPSGDLLAVEVFGVVPKAVTWILTIYLISDGLFKPYVYTDFAKGFVSLTSCAAAITIGADLVWVPWMLVTAEACCAVACVVIAARLQEFRLSAANGALAVLMVIAIGVVYLADRYLGVSYGA